MTSEKEKNAHLQKNQGRRLPTYYKTVSALMGCTIAGLLIHTVWPERDQAKNQYTETLEKKVVYLEKKSKNLEENNEKLNYYVSNFTSLYRNKLTQFTVAKKEGLSVKTASLSDYLKTTDDPKLYTSDLILGAFAHGFPTTDDHDTFMKKTSNPNFVRERQSYRIEPNTDGKILSIKQGRVEELLQTEKGIYNIAVVIESGFVCRYEDVTRPSVKLGDTVDKGQQIAEAADTMNTLGPLEKSAKRPFYFGIFNPDGSEWSLKTFYDSQSDEEAYKHLMQQYEIPKLQNMPQQELPKLQKKADEPKAKPKREKTIDDYDG